MTYQEELDSLTAAYSGWIAAGCPQSYTVAGRTVTRASAEWMSKRIDQLRFAVARGQGGGVFVAQFPGKD